MNRDEFNKRRDQLREAEGILKAIEDLDEVIVACNNPTGYMCIIANYKNQDQTHLGITNALPASDVHDLFRQHVKDAAQEAKKQLEIKFAKVDF